MTTISYAALAEDVIVQQPSPSLKAEAEHILKTEEDAKSVTVREEVTLIRKEGAQLYNFDDLDLNHDGVFSRDEVGESLFRIFDGDGNEVIDNIEMKRPTLIVFNPMQRKTIDIIEYQDAEKPVKQTVREEEFLERSKLAMFDKNEDGLSPLDFIGRSFYEINVKEDAVIDLEEWKRAYAESVRPLHMEAFNYND